MTTSEQVREQAEAMVGQVHNLTHEIHEAVE